MVRAERHLLPITLVLVFLATACDATGSSPRESKGDNARKTVQSPSSLTSTIKIPHSRTDVSQSPPVKTDETANPDSIDRKAGEYGYRETGKVKVACGALTEEGAPPSPTSLRIQRRGTKNEEWTRDRRGERGEGAVDLYVFDFRPSGQFLLELRQFRTTPFGTVEDEFEPKEAPLIVPKGRADGYRWQYSITSKNGVTVTSDNLLDATGVGSTLADGSRFSSLRLSLVNRIKGSSPQGPIDLLERSIVWIHDQTFLPVRLQSRVTGSASGCDVDEDVEANLLGLIPAS